MTLGQSTERIAYLSAVRALVRVVPRIVGSHYRLDGSSIDGPGWDVIDDALHWASTRSGRITLRRQWSASRCRVLSAGHLLIRVQTPEEFQYEFYRCQEHSLIPMTQNVNDGREAEHEGWAEGVYLVETFDDAEYGDMIGYRVEVDDAGGEEIKTIACYGPKWTDSMSEALEFARKEAEYVIVTEGPPGNEYWSAGRRKLPDIDLPQWPEVPSKPKPEAYRGKHVIDAGSIGGVLQGQTFSSGLSS